MQAAAVADALDPSAPGRSVAELVEGALVGDARVAGAAGIRFGAALAAKDPLSEVELDRDAGEALSAEELVGEPTLLALREDERLR
jgi:hypothetical protein